VEYYEFSAIEGVIEDMTEIILNLKKVRFKKTQEILENKINVRVKPDYVDCWRH
jgi:DNA-directed RNA polymerase subunit alpha